MRRQDGEQDLSCLDFTLWARGRADNRVRDVFASWLGPYPSAGAGLLGCTVRTRG